MPDRASSYHTAVKAPQHWYSGQEAPGVTPLSVSPLHVTSHDRPSSPLPQRCRRLTPESSSPPTLAPSAEPAAWLACVRCMACMQMLRGARSRGAAAQIQYGGRYVAECHDVQRGIPEVKSAKAGAVAGPCINTPNALHGNLQAPRSALQPANAARLATSGLPSTESKQTHAQCCYLHSTAQRAAQLCLRHTATVPHTYGNCARDIRVT